MNAFSFFIRKYLGVVAILLGGTIIFGAFFACVEAVILWGWLFVPLFLLLPVLGIWLIDLFVKIEKKLGL